MKTIKQLSLYMALILTLASCNKKENENIIPDNTSKIEDISKDMTWKGIIGIKGGVHVKDGATLKIEKGTKIIFLENTSYLLIEKGAKINAVGTEDEMIVFSSTEKRYGSAGGLIINGKAPVNTGASKSEIGDVEYGGNDANDNSGILKYVRIEFGGIQITDDKEHNGFTFNGVGKGTQVSHLQAYKCSDDGFEFFGGTVECSNLVAYGCEDDLFDWTYGFTGKLTNIYGEYLPNQYGDDRRALEGDNNGSNENDTPRSKPTFENVTLIDNSKNSKAAAKLRRGTYAIFNNIHLKGFFTAFDIEHTSSIDYFATNNVYKNIKIEGVQTLLKTKDSNGVSDYKKTEVTDAINLAKNNDATGFNIPSWAITSNDHSIGGDYKNAKDITEAGGIIYEVFIK